MTPAAPDFGSGHSVRSPSHRSRNEEACVAEFTSYPPAAAGGLDLASNDVRSGAGFAVAEMHAR